jgi:hypothetical protein
MLENGSKVLIFGAGSTRGAFDRVEDFPPPPIDKDFFIIANQLKGRNTNILAKRVLGEVWKLYGRVDSIGLEQYYRALETRDAVKIFHTTASRQMDWKKRINDLNELIRRVFIHTTCFMDSKVTPKKSSVHSKILKKLKSGDTIITFNYDTVIEESFENSEHWNPKYGYGKKISGVTSDWCRGWCEKNSCNKVASSNVSLLKLHGSINFDCYTNKILKLKSRPYNVSSLKTKWRSEKVSILPPGWNKPITQNPYKEIWNAAKISLQKCQTLVIVGYSLPEADVLAHSLLSEVVRIRSSRKKQYLREIHLADPDQKIREKFINLFNPALGPNAKIYKYNGIKELSEMIS